MEAFLSNRATNVVLPQPVGPATMHVNGCFQRGSMSTSEQAVLRLRLFNSNVGPLILHQRSIALIEQLLRQPIIFYTSKGAVLTPSVSTLRFPWKYVSAALSWTYVITDESRTLKPRLTPLPLRRLSNTARKVSLSMTF